MNETLVPLAGSELEFANQTTLHPLGMAAVLVLGVAMLLVPRRYALLPLIVMACFVAPAQRIVIVGSDFTLLRIMVLFGWVRLVLHGELRGLVWKPLDSAIVMWAVAGTLAQALLFGTAAALVNRLGAAFDALGLYFLCRCLLRTWDDLCRTVLSFAVVALPVAVAFLVENRTGRNLFAFLGGVPEFTLVREGRLRCQGAFAHPILAGCFWASLMPLIAGLWWWWPRQRLWVVLGLSAAAVIVVCAASSTPVFAVLAAAAGGAMYFARHRLKWVRWTALLVVIGLHLVMTAPVWHLVARVSAVGGSTGWQRFFLIDQFVKRFDEWWLLGTQSTAHWGPGLRDVTNQYVLEAVRGGLLTLLLFVLTVALAFRGVGARLRLAEPSLPHRVMTWALGVALFVHCMNFIGVSYFGQTILVWYLCLAMIGSATPAQVPAGGSALPMAAAGPVPARGVPAP